MKKIFSILIALGIMALSYQLIVNIFITHRVTEYSIKEEDDVFFVEEEFLKVKGKHIYNYFVTDRNKNSFAFYHEGEYNKQTKLLKKIISYKKEGVLCYLPIYKDESTGEVNCFIGKGKNKELVDYNALLDGSIDHSEIAKYYEHLGYSRNSWKKSSSTKKKHNINNNSVAYVYTNNLPKNYIFPIWNYHGLLFIEKSKSDTKQYIDKDIYENKFSVLVGKYYFIFNLSATSDTINDLDYINVEDRGKSSVMIPGGLSGNMYVNGVYSNKLYITDLNSKTQFCVDPFSQKVEVVGNESDGFMNLVDGKLVKMDSKEFLSSEHIFNSVSNKKLSKKYGNITMVQFDKHYYFKTEENDFYRVSMDHLDHPIKLFHFDRVSEWSGNADGIMVVSGDTMYFYNEENGLKPIMMNKELKFNHKNICNFYKKS